MKHRIYIITALLFAALFCASAPPACAEEDISEGYDENTEITANGTVTETLLRERGPIIIRLKTESKTYLVVTAPPRFLIHENITFPPGSSLEVRGSKYFGKDGYVYIISREIRLETGKIIILRGKDYRPLWRHGRH
jgi:hypothetical protein